jgi:hypothetical protein
MDQLKDVLATATAALERRDAGRVADAMKALMESTDEPARLIVTRAFLEEFLGRALVKVEPGAEVLLEALRVAGFKRHALPVILAVQAISEKREDMIGELLPELVKATRLVCDRIKSGMAASV